MYQVLDDLLLQGKDVDAGEMQDNAPSTSIGDDN
jgi:hypothetical protein